METLEILLSDKFVEFTKQVAELATQKKAKMVEFKAIYAAFQEETKNLDDQVLVLQKDFEDWKKERASNTGDG